MRPEHWIYTVPLRMRSLFRRRHVEHEMEEELDFHVDQLSAQYLARGMSAQDARTAALRDIGGVERRREELRATRQVSALENLLRDVRHAIRMLRRTPAFTAIAVITLALGIGANTAIFTVVNAVLLRPLPYGDPSRLVVIQYQDQESVAPAYLLQWQAAGMPAFESIGAANYTTPTLTGGDRPELLQALRMSPEILPMMQVKPLLGRVFLPEEGHDGRNNVIILNYAFWQRRFGGDPRVLGQQLTIDGTARTVVGVMPSGFRFAPFWATRSDFWMPQSFDGLENDRRGASFRVFGRLRPGATLAQARAEVAALGIRTKRDIPEANANITVIPLHDKVVGDVAPALWVLLAAVGLVLLIACANVTHLQLMRAAARERETAVRVALGASGGRLIQQSLVESLVVSLAGGLLGLLLAVAGVRLLVALGPDIPRLDTITVDRWVFVCLLGIAALAGIVSGVIPAFVASHVDANHALKEGGRSGQSRRRRRTGAFLVISEFAMAVILLVGAGLVLRSFAAMIGLAPGFDPHQVLSMKVSVRGTQHIDPAARGVFYQDVMTRAQALPGVASASMINHLPLHGDTWNLPFFIEGQPLPPPGEGPSARFGVIHHDYFHTMSIPLRRGRDITAADETAHAHVVVIDEYMARTYWPNDDAIGHQISVDDPTKQPDWFTVVGVVGSIEQGNWSDPRSGQMYFPYWMNAQDSGAFNLASLLYPNYMTLVLRFRGDATPIRRGVEQIVHGLDADAPVAGVITMDEVIADQVAEPRFYLVLLGGFATIALLLAAVGVYGVISHATSTRTREIGIRLALGAERGAPFKLVVRQGLQLAVIGASVGLIGALVLTRYIRTLLYDVRPNDPSTLVAVPLILIVVAVVACYVPARRAAAVDPMVVLRGE